MHGDTDSFGQGRADRQISRVLMWLVCAGATLGTLLALFSRELWVAELFSHYRLYYLLAQGVLLLVFLHTRRWLWLVATVALAVPNAWYVGPYLLPVFRTAVAGPTLPAESHLVAVNLSYRNGSHDGFIDYVRARQPEVLVMSEYTPAWHRSLSPALAEYPHRLARPRTTPFGMAIYSRVPLRAVRRLELGAPDSENFRLQLRLAGQTVELFAVHLYPPTSPRRARWRQAQLGRLAAVLSTAASPRILVGDLNLTPFSPLFTDLLGATGLLDARRRIGLHVTWPSGPLPLWIPIDHCLADVSAGVIDVRTGPAIGSDHYPLEISLAEIG